MPDLPDLILFDGDCVLCSRAAHFVHTRDPAGRFKFVAIQSPLGRMLAERFRIDANKPQSNTAVVDGVAHFKSDAALQILALAPGWAWTRFARSLPHPVRNWLYDLIAQNRYQIFGRREGCWIGDAALKSRIVSDIDELSGHP